MLYIQVNAEVIGNSNTSRRRLHATKGIRLKLQRPTVIMVTAYKGNQHTHGHQSHGKAQERNGPKETRQGISGVTQVIRIEGQ